MSCSTRRVLLFALYTCAAVLSLTAADRFGERSASVYTVPEAVKLSSKFSPPSVLSDDAKHSHRSFRATAVSRQNFDRLGEELKKMEKDNKKTGRADFVRKVISHVSSRGLNVVIVHPPSLSHGHDRIYELKPAKIGFKVYVARRSKMFQVTNAGDGGWINWGLAGRWWVRWGNTVRFHNHWNRKTMGKPYEVRSGPIPPF